MAKLEKISVHRAPSQLKPVRRFVERHKFDLSRNSPATLDHFGSFFSAVVNVGRYAIDPSILQFLVREDKTNRMMGFATIIPNIVVEPLVGETVAGNYLDYVLSDTALQPIHESVAAALLRLNERYELKHHGILESRFVGEETHAQINTIAVNRFPEKDMDAVPNRGLLRIIPPLTDVVSLESPQVTGLETQGFDPSEQVVFHYMSNRVVS
jgi:hypothetical protein